MYKLPNHFLIFDVHEFVHLALGGDISFRALAKLDTKVERIWFLNKAKEILGEKGIYPPCMAGMLIMEIDWILKALET